MIIDTSAVLAILRGEPDIKLFDDALLAARERRLSCVTHLECSITLLRKAGPNGLVDLAEFMARLNVQLVGFSEAQARIAARAYAQYGKSFHKARLNFGDCASYALAIDMGEPLLYKSDDFALTDVISALPRR